MDTDNTVFENNARGTISENQTDKPAVNSIPRLKPVIPVGRRTHYRASYWEDYSLKVKHTVGFYHDIEYDHWVLVEADASIVWFCEYPFAIQVRVDGRDVTSTLQMMVQYQDGEREVRRLAHVHDLHRDSRLWRQIEAERIWCEQHGLRYVVITDEAIYKSPLLISNWKFILHVLNAAEGTKTEAQQRAIACFLGADSRSVGEIEKSFQHIDSATLKVAVYRLLQQGWLVAPLEKEILSKTTQVRRNYARSTQK